MKWKDLGLLIVDEEHRFGVRHKERIKAMRADVDILTLTATPIPRTFEHGDERDARSVDYRHPTGPSTGRENLCT
ncbi:Transcription-repair-coupling factor [Leclercia adecarboxylata]|uniref:Transcription-repair-coupling factor n=1 Tax=Leclercia adecarboxylata TaxID=83655 RepID=A0A4U9HSR9_9ENTR|nr:Transcription-repair-coupling factor [Leclercia adecarboxylata]